MQDLVNALAYIRPAELYDYELDNVYNSFYILTDIQARIRRKYSSDGEIINEFHLGCLRKHLKFFVTIGPDKDGVKFGSDSFAMELAKFY